ncbi:MAG: hypothetical protein VB118_01335 [Oscillospiraceae bacterium]|nr:hypothetical protein [Oscillospiraceae bacterium]
MEWQSLSSANTKRYTDSTKRVSELKEELIAVLTPEDVVKLESLIVAMFDSSDEMSKEAYRMGIRFGFDLSKAIEDSNKTLPKKNRESDQQPE